MLVGNKSDLREELTKCVKIEDGQRLARVSLSALLGKNIILFYKH